MSHWWRIVRAGVAATAFVLLWWAGACSDNPVDVCSGCPPPGETLVVSDPASAPAMTARGVTSSALASTVANEVTYVSLTPGTVLSGRTAIIRRAGDLGSIVTAISSGGFDPVPISASAGDSIDLLVKTATGGTVLHSGLRVAASRPPIVVRTNPPRKKKDVPLNAAIVIVFSEPVDAGTLSSSVRLFRGGSSVAGTVSVLQGSGSAVAFKPTTPLARNADYRLVVSGSVRDFDGDALGTGTTVSFSTGQSSTGPVASVMLSPDTVYLTGATYQMTATVRDTAGNELIDQSITWSTSDPAALSVSATGLVNALGQAGQFGVTASVNGLIASATVIVPAGPPASVTLAPAQATVGAGSDTIKLIATVRDAAEHLLDHPSVTWTSSDPAIATVAPDSSGSGGLAFATVTGVGLGNLTIAATSGSVGATASVTVTPAPPVAFVTVTPASATLVVQATRQLSAAVHAANGKVLGGRPVTWTTDNAAVATVDANGVVTGVAVGSAAVIAAREGVSDTATITVTLLSFASVTSGGAHTCGLTPDGTAYCWGSNAVGELGVGSTTGPEQCSSPSGQRPCSWFPVSPSGGLTFVELSAGPSHTCGVTTSGSLYCWGQNEWGELGIGNATGPEQCAGTPCSTRPVAVNGGITFASVSAGDSRTCALTPSGAAYCWGTIIATGPELCGWGVPCNTSPVLVPGGLTFIKLSDGFSGHICGITATGAAYCWGANYGGQLGNGSTVDAPAPVPVRGAHTFSSVSTGFRPHTCGVTTSGGAYCWGSNDFGALGNGLLTSSSVPVAVIGGLTFADVKIGGDRFPQACGVTTAGATYCWGNYRFDDGAVTSPQPVANGLVFKRVSIGREHLCGVTVSAIAYCWGRLGGPQLGNPAQGSHTPESPVKVAGQP